MTLSVVTASPPSSLVISVRRAIEIQLTPILDYMFQYLLAGMMKASEKQSAGVVFNEMKGGLFTA
ncbi:hypothetical protein F2Q69_00018272 [Brassica cretica]|uniref:Uncharacterized protein n=1 Tax=Brassica cretica TaxID=69181 RepID=A0A8S9QDJ8_BRACR|nr:hypothetical protein F2Q69_00018272 [Brassica cretica]